MPFTPFHMGAGLIAKAAANHRFSVITFGIAQITMDIEPLVGMLRGSPVLHGFTHTFVGALLIGIAVMWVSPFICRPILQGYNSEVGFMRLGWLACPERLRSAVVAGAFFGTFSHIVLDSFMHTDIRPFYPFSDQNPLLGLIAVDELYGLCSVSAVVGLLGWIYVKYKQRACLPRMYRR